MAEESSTKSKKKRWFPLESNPALINSYISKLGYETSLYEFVDVFSTEDWALDMIAQPVAAVLMLYPLTATQLANTPKEESTDAALPPQENVWFIKQRVGNACGTIGLLHSLLNLPEPLNCMVREGSWLEQFANDCPIPLDPIQKAAILEKDSKIEKMHDAATSDETNATDRGRTTDEDILTHFVALVCVQNRLYELDGRKQGPVDHGPTSQATLLKDAIRVIQKFMARDPTEMRFTMTALAPK
eukprot:CAMPEP_0116143144 /NCGR_PEP_ID=MMETSP0329-20121206/15291_1 /TAXON_ID=697910 /ORGANISM="Pseudo-nitzschia arenysensis, Strain B593" /LENGTH=243 /DNA_ID=CAMNT_0003638439 /DNA_START=69 /DNA_END=800 /DNA_ORIENTATION=-